MALINCPECNKEISDKSDKCIHCGYPIKNNNCFINGTSYDLSFLLDENISVPFKAKQLHLLTKCDLKDCIERTKEIVEKKQLPQTLTLKPSRPKQEDNKPKCPKCKSTNIQIVPRKWSLFAGFATNKTDRVCVNCKHKW